MACCLKHVRRGPLFGHPLWATTGNLRSSTARFWKRLRDPLVIAACPTAAISRPDGGGRKTVKIKEEALHVLRQLHTMCMLFPDDKEGDWLTIMAGGKVPTGSRRQVLEGRGGRCAEHPSAYPEAVAVVSRSSMLRQGCESMSALGWAERIGWERFLDSAVSVHPAPDRRLSVGLRYVSDLDAVQVQPMRPLAVTDAGLRAF